MANNIDHILAHLYGQWRSSVEAKLGSGPCLPATHFEVPGRFTKEEPLQAYKLRVTRSKLACSKAVIRVVLANHPQPVVRGCVFSINQAPVRCFGS
jgi:hypothetical protein